LKIGYWSLIISALTLGLTLYAYQSTKLSTPLIILGLLIFFGKRTWSQLRIKSLIPLALLAIFFTPIIIGLLTDTSGRLKVFSAFSYTRPSEEIQTLILDQDQTTTNSLTFQLFHSENLNHLRTLLGHYFNHFSGRFLLFQGDWTHPAHHVPYFGYFYWLDALAIFFTIYLIANILPRHSEPDEIGSKNPQRIQNQSTAITFRKSSQLYFLLYWLAVSPLPAVLSRDQVHAIRSLNMIIPLIILLTLGWTSIIRRITHLKKIFKYSVFYILFSVFLYNIILYFDAYYTHFPINASQDFQYGHKQLVEALKPSIEKGQPIVISQSYAQPYIFFLFHLQYPPQKYQTQAQLSASPTSSQGDVGFVEKLDNVTFRSINWSVDQYEKGTIFAADPVTTIHPELSSDPSRFNLISEINYLNGTPAFRVVEVL
jgi:hypothetical protein